MPGGNPRLLKEENMSFKKTRQDREALRKADIAELSERLAILEDCLEEILLRGGASDRPRILRAEIDWVKGNLSNLKQ